MRRREGSLADCADGHHTPDDVEVETNGFTTSLRATCLVCRAQLDAEVRVRDWNAVWEVLDTCALCSEAECFCECTGGFQAR